MITPDENTNKHGLALDVGDFYDQHPYPPPVEDLDEYRKIWQDPARQRWDFHRFWPAKPYAAELDILIAGCGTSQAARHALRLPEARIVAIDVSQASVDHTLDLKKKYDLKNLEVQRLAIEDVADLGQTFDKIVCTGVLHHLADPADGLRALHGMLTPDGAIHLMLYAAYGRAGIYMLQDYARLLGIGTSREEVDELAQALLALPPDHPLAVLIGETRTLRNRTEIIDALLHPRDRAYTVPEVFDLLEECSLAFGRRYEQAPYSPHCGLLARTPHSERLAGLALAEQYEAAELFRGNMLKHDLVAYIDMEVARQNVIIFEGDGWLNYVPLRVLWGEVIQEDLPTGAAAMLINPWHTFTDLVYPIDPHQLTLFEAIDGQHTAGELIEVNNQLDHETARQFFEELWWYDQVVFAFHEA